jgi:hypothetical protein
MTKTKQNNTNKNKTTTQQTTTQTEQTKDNAHNRNKNGNKKPTIRASRQKSINSFVAQTKPKTPKKTQPNEHTRRPGGAGRLEFFSTAVLKN